MRNPYEVLGVEVGASQSEIRKAYLNKMKQYHPDKNNGDKNAERIAQEINEAYSLLLNPTSFDFSFGLEQKRQQAIKIVQKFVYTSDFAKEMLIKLIEQTTEESEINAYIRRATAAEQQKKELEQYKEKLFSMFDSKILNKYSEIIKDADSKEEVDKIMDYIFETIYNECIEERINLINNMSFISNKNKEDYIKLIKDKKPKDDAEELREIEHIMSTAIKQNEETIKLFKQYGLYDLVSKLNSDEIGMFVILVQNENNIDDIKEFLKIYLVLRKIRNSESRLNYVEQFLSDPNISKFTREILEETRKTFREQKNEIDGRYDYINKDKKIDKNKLYNDKIIKEKIIPDGYDDIIVKR